MSQIFLSSYATFDLAAAAAVTAGVPLIMDPGATVQTLTTNTAYDVVLIPAGGTVNIASAIQLTVRDVAPIPMKVFNCQGAYQATGYVKLTYGSELRATHFGVVFDATTSGGGTDSAVPINALLRSQIASQGVADGTYTPGRAVTVLFDGAYCRSTQDVTASLTISGTTTPLHNVMIKGLGKKATTIYLDGSGTVGTQATALGGSYVGHFNRDEAITFSGGTGNIRCRETTLVFGTHWTAEPLPGETITDSNGHHGTVYQTSVAGGVATVRVTNMNGTFVSGHTVSFSTSTDTPTIASIPSVQAELYNLTATPAASATLTGSVTGATFVVSSTKSIVQGLYLNGDGTGDNMFSQPTIRDLTLHAIGGATRCLTVQGGNGLSIDSVRIGGADGVGMLLRDCQNVPTVKNTYVDTCGNDGLPQIEVDGTDSATQSAGMQFDGLSVQNSRSGCLAGIWIDRTWTSSIRNSVIQATGIPIQVYSKYDSNYANTCFDFLIDNTDLEAPGDYARYMDIGRGNGSASPMTLVTIGDNCNGSTSGSSNVLTGVVVAGVQGFTRRSSRFYCHTGGTQYVAITTHGGVRCSGVIMPAFADNAFPGPSVETHLSLEGVATNCRPDRQWTNIVGDPLSYSEFTTATGSVVWNPGIDGAVFNYKGTASGNVSVYPQNWYNEHDGTEITVLNNGTMNGHLLQVSLTAGYTTIPAGSYLKAKYAGTNNFIKIAEGTI